MPNTAPGTVRQLHQQIAAAEVLGRLVGRGLLSLDECTEPLVHAAYRAAPRLDRAGTRTHLVHLVRDAAHDEMMRIARLERDLWRVIEPLARQRAPGHRIMLAANLENARAGHPLDPEQLLAKARAIAFAVLRSGRSHGRG